jgi:ACS family hexuronate transporter-like MFS transporter
MPLAQPANLAFKPTIGTFRWSIVALLFLATTINYVDRNVLSFVMADDVFRREMMRIDPSAPITQAQHKAFLIEYGKVDAVSRWPMQPALW